MLKCFLGRSAALLLAAATPTLIYAQFLQPTDEELKMTADPKAPGAAAVYLNIDENHGVEKGLATFHLRIKVLTPQGKDLATVAIPYFRDLERVSAIKGRTIHPDGTEIPLTNPPEDQPSDQITGQPVDHKVFTLPSVQVGSILEYSYQIQGLGGFDPNDNMSWELQRPYFAHQEHFVWAPPSELVTAGDGAVRGIVPAYTLPAGASMQRDAQGHYVLDVSDIPAIPSEPWMPPLRYLAYQAHFFRVDAASVEDYWNHQSAQWAGRVNELATPSPAIKDAVGRIVVAGDSDLDKAKKLYAAVQKLSNSDFSRRKSGPEHKQLQDCRHATEIWAQHGGSANELALLYLSMLRAAGLTAYAIEVSSREQGLFIARYTDIGQLDSLLVILKTGDTETFLDPGEKMCPFGMLSWKHAEAGGIRESAEGYGAGATPAPPYSDNSTLRSGDLNVDMHGTVSGALRLTMTGQEALRWRQLAIVSDAAELRAQFNKELAVMVPDGVTARLDHFIGLDDSNAYLVASVIVKGNLGTATAQQLTLPGVFFETHGSEPFAREEMRRAPVDLHYDAVVTDEMVYHLPQGATVAAVPADAKELWKDHAVFYARYKSEPSQVTAARSLARAFSLARQNEYPELHGFYQKVAAADQARIVVNLASSTKSN